MDSNVPHRRRFAARCLSAVLLLGAFAGMSAAPAPAAASTTIGSPLAPNGSGAAVGGCSPLCTLIPLSISTGNPVQSPIDGVIVRWGVSAADTPGDTSTVRLRVLRSPAFGQFVGVSTGPIEHTTGGFLNSFFSVQPGTPISAGDYMGVDTARDDGSANASLMRVQSGSSTGRFSFPLPNGGAPQTAVVDSNIEMFGQATIEPDADGDLYGDETQDGCSVEADNHGPCSQFTLGKPRLNKRKGTAKLPVTVPGAGQVVVMGRGVADRIADAAGTGTVKVKIRTKGKAKKRLERRGRVRVNVEVTFTPTGGAARSQTTRVKLRKKSG